MIRSSWKSPWKVHRGHIAFVHDLVMAVLSFVIALYLRQGEEFLFQPVRLMQGGGLFTIVCGVVFWNSRLYRGIWRYASINDFFTLTRAVTLAILIFLPLLFLLTRLDALPRSALIINWLVLMALLGGPRLFYRWFKDRRFHPSPEGPVHRRIPVLLIGADDNAELFLRALHRTSDSEYRVVGIVSEHPGRVGRNIHDVPVLGTMANIPEIVHALAENRPRKLILTSETFDGALVRQLLDTAEGLGLTLARLPRLTDLKAGLTDTVELRPIEVEDLLSRPQRVLDRDTMKALIAGRRVLVTGAGGTIGSELVRQITAFGPARLALFEASEFNLYTIDRTLAEQYPDVPRTAKIGDVRDALRVNQVLAEERPELVFHAAALKHVPMVEDNPFEGVLTNIHGTRLIADACRVHGVHLMVQISTDKAVTPTSLMGVTKRVTELYCQALDGLGGADETRFVTVRFGNVLDSTGSVVPLFRRQLAAGGPLTVTHPDITRYFMTVREAVELVLQACALQTRADPYRGRIFVLNMGEPVRIADLARQMIRLAGRQDVQVVYTGVRKGEKLFEDLFYATESPVPTACDDIMVAAAPTVMAYEAIAPALENCVAACREGDSPRLMKTLRELVPEYQAGAYRE